MAWGYVTSHKTNSVPQNSHKKNSNAGIVCHMDVQVR